MLVADREGGRWPRRSGLWIPETAVYGNRLFGQVVAVGDGVNGIEWGDLFELTRWVAEWWWKRPIPDVFGLYGDAWRILFRPPLRSHAGGGEEVVLGPGSHLAILRPHQLVARIARRDWVFHRRGQPSRPEPVADRVMVRHRQRPERSTGGILLPGDGLPDPVGEVLAAGPDACDLAPGHWCLVPRGRGTLLRRAGEVYTIVREREIPLRWDGEPEGRIEL